MTDSQDPKVQRARERREFWKEVIFPMANRFERFFWNLAWFALIFCVLFAFNPFR